MKLVVESTKTSLGAVYNMDIQDVEMDVLKELMGVIEHLDFINKTNMEKW